MKTEIARFKPTPSLGVLKKVFTLFLAVFAALEMNAQSTAFTYQGRLNDGANLANGSYDFTFTLFDAASAGSQVGSVVTNAASAVSNGLFTVTLDFGGVAFTGADRWLEIAVATNGVSLFSTLSPRQQITSAPYAIRAGSAASANSVAAANISGVLATSQLPSSIVTNGASGVMLAGNFSGNGSGLINLNGGSVTGLLNSAVIPNLDAAKIASGTLSDARLSANVPLLNGANVFSGTNRFSGTAILTNANNQIAGSFSGNGSGLTALNAGSLTGVVSLASLPAAVVTNGESGLSLGGIFTGNGAALTNLAATNLAGTLPDARLSTNVALRTGGNIFSGVQQVTDTIISGPQIVDQQQLIKAGSGGSTDNWQSFTAGTNGFLVVVALQVGSPTPSPSPGTVRIYAGEGTGGALLATEAVTWQPVINTFQTCTLTAQPLLQAGSQYTIRFSAPSIFSAWVYHNTTDPYPGGRADWSTSVDYSFKTFMIPIATNATVLMINPGLSGNVGIGTNAPQARLHVVGDIFASGSLNIGDLTTTGTFTGNGATVTNLNAANLTAGTVADARLSVNVPLLNGANVFSGTNRFSGPTILTNVNNQITGSFSGNGGGLTVLNAGSLTGVVSLASLPAAVVTDGEGGLTLSGAFTGSGAGLTNLGAGNISSGTLADARLSVNVTFLNGTNVFSGTNRFSGPAILTNANNQITGSFSGNGGGLTSLNAGSLTGVVSLASLPAVVVTNGGNWIGTFIGNGATLTNLAATNIAGTLSDARLSANVALRTGGNTFSGVQQVADTVITGPQVLDQQQLDATGSAGSTDHWQSFTAGTNGFLNAVALLVGSPIYPNGSAGTIRIYAGEGTGGTLLATESVTWQPYVSTFQTYTIFASPLLQAGSLYTIRFSAPSASIAWVSHNAGNPYAGGRTETISTRDYGFKTFMTPVAINATILTVNPELSGNVGIGTNSPQARLHVAGDILASGMVIGNGAGLTDLSTTNLTGTVTDAQLSGNVALLNGTNAFSGSNTFAGTNTFTGTLLGSPPYLMFMETTANVSAGASVAGGNNFREFNVEVTDTHSLGATNGTGNIILPAGTYQCRISAPAFRVETHQIRLRTSGGSNLLFGTVGYSDSSSGGSADRSQIEGQFTLNATTTLRVQHYCTLAQASGLGFLQSFSWGDNVNQYNFAVAEFWKIK